MIADISGGESLVNWNTFRFCGSSNLC